MEGVGVCYPATSMHRLAPEELERIRPLVPPSDVAGHMTFVWAMLERRMAGEVFVDDPAAPRTAFACSGTGFYFALGAPQPELVEPWLLALADALPSEEPGVLWATSDAWRTALDPLFPVRQQRTEYRFTPPPAVPPVDPPFGYQLVDLDAEWAGCLDESMDDFLVRVWGGPESAAAHTFGTALVAGVRVVSFCGACAIGGGEAEVEVQTAPAFGDRGLATLVARAFLRQCVERGLRPAWTAAADNEASDRLARRLGFEPVRTITGYPLSLDATAAAA